MKALSRFARVAGAITLAVGAWSTGTAHAQEYTVSFEAGVGGPAGSEQTITAILDIAAGATVLSGWSVGFCHDVDVLNPVAASAGSTTLVVNDGSPPDFEQTNVVDNDATLGVGETPGVNQGVVINFLGTETLGAGTGYELVDATYLLSGPDTFTEISYCDTTPAGQLVSTVVVVSGQSVVPTKVPGTIEVGAIFPPGLSIASDLVVDSGTPVSAPVTLDSSEFDIYGFSFGLSHDSAVVDLVDISAGADTAAADFFHVETAPANGDGGVVAAILSTAAPLEFLAQFGSYEVAIFQYDVAAGAATDDSSALSFVGNLQPAPTSPETPLLISLGQDGIEPVTTNGAITVGITTGGGPLFVRGDANSDGTVDVSDGVFTLGFLFSGGDTPACLSSCDGNDDGGVDVSDAVYILGFLFSGGDPIPAPNTCGVDPTDDTLTCDSFPPCP
ncbi:MAG: hypothetical protein AAF488_13505 [Planctomycetota bacterium]